MRIGSGTSQQENKLELTEEERREAVANVEKIEAKALSEEVMKNNSTYRVLIVDDNDGALDTMQINLRNIGIDKVTRTTNPVEALEMIKSNDSFDILITDYLMTPINGDELVSEIRKTNFSLFIIIVTGYSDRKPPLETVASLNIQGYCQKTDKMDELNVWIQSGIKSIEQNKRIRQLYAEAKSYSEEVEKLHSELEHNYYEVIDTLRKVVDAKDTYTRGHADRVAMFSVYLGKQINLSEEMLKALKIGGLFHDIGKIGIRDEILKKETQLTNEEYEHIKKHALIGHSLIYNNKMFDKVVPAIRNHHERYDGNGYPDRLSGENIPLIARIVAIADAFDAMTSRRNYNDPKTFINAKEELKKNASTQFDTILVDKFIEAFNSNQKQIEEEITKIANENLLNDQLSLHKVI